MTITPFTIVGRGVVVVGTRLPPKSSTPSTGVGRGRRVTVVPPTLRGIVLLVMLVVRVLEVGLMLLSCCSGHNHSCGGHSRVGGQAIQLGL